MDKKLRNILILAGVLILLCIGYAVAGLIFKEDTAAEQESEMVKEAVRIISSCRPPLQKKKESRKSALFYFICGIACALITLFAGGLFLLLLRSCGLF